MRTRFRFLPGVLIPVLLLGWSACNSSSLTTSSTNGFLFVGTQGDSLVSSYSVDLATGKLATNGTGAATGSVPSAMILAPSGTALFVANSNPAIPSSGSPCGLPNPGTVTAYTVGTDGKLAAVSGNSTAGSIPVAMATDSAGHFLFVANQGLQCDPASGTISVFSIQDTTLTQVSGSPFHVPALQLSSGSGPTGVAVTPDGKFLYVTSQFDGTVTVFSVDSTGVLRGGTTLPVGTAPSVLYMSPDGGFLYVANSGSSDVSAFAVCNQVLTSCGNPNSPDGALTPVAGSPFSAGLGPSSMIAAGSGKFLFVIDRQSNQVSEYKVATGTGILTPNTQSTISTGGSPVALAVRSGTKVVSSTKGTTDYLFVANLGASTVSVYSFDSTVGVLGLVGTPATTNAQPSAIAAK